MKMLIVQSVKYVFAKARQMLMVTPRSTPKCSKTWRCYIAGELCGFIKVTLQNVPSVGCVERCTIFWLKPGDVCSYTEEVFSIDPEGNAKDVN